MSANTGGSFCVGSGQPAPVVRVLLYVHRNRRLIRDGEPRTATATFTQFLSSDIGSECAVIFFFFFFYQFPDISMTMAGWSGWALPCWRARWVLFVEAVRAELRRW